MVLDRSILKYLPARRTNSHKGTYGKLLCAAGSKNMAGAAYLSSCAAYRTGAGLVRVLTPEDNRVILQQLIPEAVLTTFDTGHPDDRMFGESFEWADAAAIGPGLGRESWAAALVEKMMKEYHKPLVVDADGLNHLAARPELLASHEGPVIVTPHAGEFSRLTGLPIGEFAGKLPDAAAEFAVSRGCICVLKGAPSAVAAPDGRTWVNATGNNGMSTGGSGDVLTGIIAGLLGQGTAPLEAALLGVWLHGRAGDIAVQTEGTYGMMARHLLGCLPQAMQDKGESRV